MAGIYVHIPYCRKKCTYCSFFSTADLSSLSLYTQALIREIRERSTEVSEPIQTIYLGGGTPSLLSIDHLQEIIKALYSEFDCSQIKEFTLEGNPDSLTQDYLSDLKRYTPINRLSIGVQSFDDDDLKRIHRLHSATQAKKCISDALFLGFDNLSIDLIYGISGSSLEKWIQNLDYFFSMPIPHLSAYALTVEEGSMLKKQIEKGLETQVDEDFLLKQYQILQEKICEHDFIAYETSNYCKPGKYSVHNSNYWKMQTYLGLGASSHSYDGKCRQWNTSQLNQYIGAKTTDEFVEDKEYLSQEDRLNEYIMLSLRTIWGISKLELERFNSTKILSLKTKLDIWIQDGYILDDEKHYFLSEKGRLLADRIASSLFC